MNVHYFFFGILMLFLIAMPVFLIWDWNKNRKLPFAVLLKNFWHKRKGFISVLVGLLISNFFIPLHKNNGIEFNSERELRGIPTLQYFWKTDQEQSDKYTIHWQKPGPKNGHFKKVITYGFLNVQSETDYYHNPHRKGTVAWSTYDYDRQTFTYFIEKPNAQKTSLTGSGTVKPEQLSTIEKVEKAEFDAYISEYND